MAIIIYQYLEYWHNTTKGNIFLLKFTDIAYISDQY